MQALVNFCFSLFLFTMRSISEHKISFFLRFYLTCILHLCIIIQLTRIFCRFIHTVPRESLFLLSSLVAKCNVFCTL